MGTKHANYCIVYHHKQSAWATMLLLIKSFTTSDFSEKIKSSKLSGASHLSGSLTTASLSCLK